jgi:hypothetical protein
MADFLSRDTRRMGEQIGQVFHLGEETEFVFGRGTMIFSRAPVEFYGWTQARVVSDANEKWFEFGFRIDHALTGNGTTGWTDAENYLRIDAQWSPDLVNWSMGKFVPAPVPVVDLGDGSYEYWSRAIHPQDAAVKSGALVCGQTNGDVRNNGFTSLVIAGVAQALAHFPYDMSVAGTAAQLQADLIAIGWTGTVVTGSTAATWSISIPSVNYASYAQTSYVGIPSYTIPALPGFPDNIVDRIDFSGSFVDASAAAIFRQAFGRLKISGGSRYDPYR